MASRKINKEFNFTYLTEDFILIDKDRIIIKLYPFEHLSKTSSNINAIALGYGCVYKQAFKTVMKLKISKMEKSYIRNY